VDIQTRSIPEKLTYAVSLGAENNSMATGNDAFLTYEGGGTPLLGGGADDRALPEAAKEAYKSIPPIPNNLFRAPYTAEKIAISDAYDRLVRSFDPAMGVTTDTPGLNGSFSFVGGNRWERGNDRVLGILGALTFQHKYDLMEDAQNNNGTVSLPDQPMQLVSRSETRGTEETLTGLLINFEFVAGQNQRYALNLIGNRSAEDEARFQVQTLGGGVERQNQALHYTERFVGSAQIHGEHHSGEKQGQGLDWFVAYNDTSQEEPDVRFFRNDFNNETLVGLKPRDSTDPSNTRRIWRDVGESNWQSAVNYSLPFSTWGDLSATLRGGVRLDRTDRDYEQRSFTYNFPTQAPGNDAARENLQLASFHATDADQLWTDVFTDSNRIGLATNHPPAPNQLLWIITPLTSSDVDYTGSQDIDAAFAMAEFPFRSNFKAIAGVRLESTDLSVIPTNERLGKVDVIVVNPDSGDRGIQRVDQELAVADIKDKALLPSAGLVWSIRQGMSLRGTVSATIARPNFRELAPVATEEFIFGDEYVGNPDLTLSRINNYDLRWEWFPRPGAVLAGSAFYKQIRNPIELISFAAGGRSFIQPVNYERGKLSGVELEARSSMEWAADWLKDLSVGVNLTLINSEVEVPASEQESLASFELDEPTRRLQGQPDKIWNANLTYDSERFGTSVGIFYNVTGEMLLTGAARGAEDAVPNVFQEEFKSLDVTLAQRIGKGFSVAVKGKNLLAPEARTVYRTPSGEETVKTERETARLLGISFTWKW
ncbi:MAG TPA: TonB-dependent receptor, partial [Candidatus Polarisedimenticolia bacterium]|nr:TonB-dependent receptor [Candidatus Polarisedimenticolia bacterium]